MKHKVKEIYLLQISGVGAKYKDKGFLFANCFINSSNKILNYYIKQFPLQSSGASLKRYVKKWVNKNAHSLGKCKKFFNILDQQYKEYVVHDIQTVPHGDRLHFSTVFKIYSKDKKLKIDVME